MKNLKMLLAAFITASVLIIGGCSDQITSTSAADSEAAGQTGILEADSQIDRPLFHTQIRLKPFRSYTFNLSNTGLAIINSVKVERMYLQTTKDIYQDRCKDIKVYINLNEKMELNCSAVKFDTKELTVSNTGSSMIDVDVVLTGRKPEAGITKK